MEPEAENRRINCSMVLDAWRLPRDRSLNREGSMSEYKTLSGGL